MLTLKLAGPNWGPQGNRNLVETGPPENNPFDTTLQWCCYSRVWRIMVFRAKSRGSTCLTGAGSLSHRMPARSGFPDSHMDKLRGRASAFEAESRGFGRAKPKRRVSRRSPPVPLPAPCQRSCLRGLPRRRKYKRWRASTNSLSELRLCHVFSVRDSPLAWRRLVPRRGENALRSGDLRAPAGRRSG